MITSIVQPALAFWYEWIVSGSISPYSNNFFEKTKQKRTFFYPFIFWVIRFELCAALMLSVLLSSSPVWRDGRQLGRQSFGCRAVWLAQVLYRNGHIYSSGCATTTDRFDSYTAAYTSPHCLSGYVCTHSYIVCCVSNDDWPKPTDKIRAHPTVW